MLNRTLTPHSMINGNACFAYFNKIWGIPRSKCATELPILLALLASVKLSYRTSFEIAD